ncbi:hypothetical protein N0V93_005754 [Gnomoniopsis smithogilvyi]|uniref:Uncharacterized protein n=1 Tax=Gnomoniopsis smithogilvyi TaxID=1191159 RepID=A0A9W8YV30_9PEZI|nr:hypothetical protein N0V93_005754 [Gnomoniopsis smithogilvyi]
MQPNAQGGLDRPTTNTTAGPLIAASTTHSDSIITSSIPSNLWSWAPTTEGQAQDILGPSGPDDSLCWLDHPGDEVMDDYATLFSHDGTNTTPGTASSSPKPHLRAYFSDLTKETVVRPLTMGLQSSPESDPGLAELNHYLSKQLYAFTTGSPLSSSRKQSPGQISESDETVQSPNPGDALQGISKFLSVVQSYQTRPTIIITLNLLTAYLHVVAICNHVFIRLNSQLQNRSSEHKTEEFQPLPGLQLAGVVFQQGELQMKILTQAILHHFQALEETLGLPPDLCISGPQEVQNGLLGDASGRGLDWKGIICSGIPNAAGLDTLASLRANILQVRQLLQI